jgi:hypothetical protein
LGFFDLRFAAQRFFDARRGQHEFWILIRADSRFFSGILHPHLLGDCRPNRFLNKENPTRLTGGGTIKKTRLLL